MVKYRDGDESSILIEKKEKLCKELKVYFAANLHALTL